MFSIFTSTYIWLIFMVNLGTLPGRCYVSFTECKYYWRDPFFTSMIMGGRVFGLQDVALRSLAAFFVRGVDTCFEIKTL